MVRCVVDVITLVLVLVLVLRHSIENRSKGHLSTMTGKLCSRMAVVDRFICIATLSEISLLGTVNKRQLNVAKSVAYPFNQSEQTFPFQPIRSETKQ